MNKYRVLIIDDDHDLLSCLKEWLEMNGHTVMEALLADEIDWMSNWQWVDIDCIITGINNPGLLSGIEFAKMVRATGGPPVIVMSGYQPEIAKIEALAAGAAAFFKKPFDLNALLKAVELVAGDCR